MEAPANDVRHLFVYRISSGGYKKEKPQYITKESCLNNFVKTLAEFAAETKTGWRLRVICDNCQPELRTFVGQAVGSLPEASVEVVDTSHGNGAASFTDGLEFAIDVRFADDCKVYFVEDDYLHTEGAIEAIFEGWEHAEVATGYDHPDKYQRNVDDKGKVNPLPAVPLVKKGAEEGSAVFLGRSGHFRRTNSTTMTFAATCGTLRRCERTIRRWTCGTHPHDFYMFLDLSHADSCSLVCTLPARSTHGETRFLSPHPHGGQTWESIGRASLRKAKKRRV